MGSESKAHEAEGRMGYWLNNNNTKCFFLHDHKEITVLQKLLV